MTVHFQVQPRMPVSWPGATATAGVVTWFLAHVRVTGDPLAANQIMAPLVLCHQLISEAPVAVERTPSEYARPVQEMLATFGRFRFTVTELLTDGDRVLPALGASPAAASQSTGSSSTVWVSDGS